jgi:hypothetical protein
MGIKAKFSRADVRKMIQLKKAKIEVDILDIMAYVGEEFVANVRNGVAIDQGAFPKGDYTDRTANLRGSIGYFILKNGSIVKRALSGSKEGKTAAKTMLASIPKKGSGYHLIGVAGMDYASYLEAMGYNVISSQSQVALVDLSKYLKAYAGRKGFDMDVNNSGVMVQMR